MRYPVNHGSMMTWRRGSVEERRRTNDTRTLSGRFQSMLSCYEWRYRLSQIYPTHRSEGCRNMLLLCKHENREYEEASDKHLDEDGLCFVDSRSWIGATDTICISPHILMKRCGVCSLEGNWSGGQSVDDRSGCNTTDELRHTI